MRKLCAIFAVLAVVAVAGCGSSSSTSTQQHYKSKGKHPQGKVSY
ncbi:MAG TPA: hypothetical protein VH025_08480 [Solirubrobacteraceae bacterium]|jgi:outer membrane lipoprotein SlyB|nr:hypothetical protein [Solirubrobacteraceae bacterium]